MAEKDGGAIYSNKDSFIHYSIFNGNVAKRDAGAIYFLERGLVTSCDFNDNYADGNGGAILSKIYGTVTNSNFNNNYADLASGAIESHGGGTVDNCAFNNNTAGWIVGAVRIYDDGVVRNSNFTNNKGRYGGALNLYENGKVESSQFINNSGDIGGAIYFNDGGTVDNSGFEKNSAENGGAISIYLGTLNINNSTFIDNAASSGTNNVDLGDRAALITNNVTPEDLGPLKRIIVDVAVENITFGQNLIVNVLNVTSQGSVLEGSMVLIIGNQSDERDLVDGATQFSIPDLESGFYTAKLNYMNGSELILTKTIEFTVNSLNASLEIITVTNVTYGDAVNITAKVCYGDVPINEGNISIVIDDEKYSSKLENGIATIIISNLNAGKYTNAVTYEGKNYNALANVTFSVSKRVLYLDFNVTDVVFGDDVKITVQVSGVDSLNEGNVSVVINNETYSTNIVNNYGLITISGLNEGLYSSNLIYDGGENYNVPSKLISFSVSKKVLSLDFNVSDVTYGDSVKILVYLSGVDSLNEGNVSIVINNVAYYANIENNRGSIIIPGLNAGSYSSNITYDGGKNYYCSYKLISFKVLKQNSKIAASNKAFVINYGGKYSITLKDAKGKVIAGQKITFILNGKKIGIATTNSKGVATIALSAKILKTAKAGTKNLVIGLNSANYQASKKSVKIKINKEKTKITAKKKKFKRTKKVKKYTIKLKNSKNKAVKKVKVTLKIKKKTYKAKTNKKGKATFKIKKFTKKGTFKATIKFKGNAYYKKVTKKVKIKVK